MVIYLLPYEHILKVVLIGFPDKIGGGMRKTEGGKICRSVQDA